MLIKRLVLKTRGLSLLELQDRLKEKGIYYEDIKNNSDDIFLRRANNLPPPEKFTVVLLYPSDLGLENPCYKKIRERSQEIGLKLCPIELAYYLRQSYDEQSIGERIFVVTNPIKRNVGCWNNYTLIVLERDENNLFLKYAPIINYQWEKESKLAFVIPSDPKERENLISWLKD